MSTAPQASGACEISNSNASIFDKKKVAMPREWASPQPPKILRKLRWDEERRRPKDREDAGEIGLRKEEGRLGILKSGT